MRLLQVNKFFFRGGGAETYFFDVIQGLRRRGHLTAEFAMEHPQNLPSKWSSYFVSRIDYYTRNPLEKAKIGAKLIYSPEARRKISALTRDFRPHLAHLNNFMHQLTASILGPLAQRKIPMVLTVHDLKPVCPTYKMLRQGQVCEKCMGGNFYHCLILKCSFDSYLKSLLNTVELYYHRWAQVYSRISLFICPSNFYRLKLIEGGLPSQRVVHLPNFVHLEGFRPQYQNRGYFLYFGRLSAEKDVACLIRAMAVLKSARLVIAGSGPEEERLHAMTREEGLQNVHFAGFASGEDLRDLVRGCICTVLPSRWYENGPLSLLESFAHGKAVIGADIGGIPEHITPGKDGFLFPPGDHSRLAAEMARFLRKPHLAAELGRNAREKAERLYGREHYLDKLVKAYQIVLGSS